jgi:hypothetical protein
MNAKKGVMPKAFAPMPNEGKVKVDVMDAFYGNQRFFAGTARLDLFALRE